MSSDWLRPDWFADTVRAWTPGGLTPPSMAEAMRPMVELFGFAPAALAQGLVEAAASHLVGQPLTLQAGDREITLVLRRVQPEPAPLGLAIGQLGTVVVEADDVVVGDLRMAEVRLVVRNLHIQPGVATATVVAAPIHIRAAFDQAAVDEVVGRRTPHVAVELRADGRARLRLRSRRDWGHVDATARIDGRRLALDPSTAALGRWDLSPAARRLPDVHLDLPATLSSTHVTDVAIEEGRLVVGAIYEEWRAEMGAPDLVDLRRRVQRHEAGPLRIR